MERCNSTLQREFNRSEAATWSGRRTLSVCGSTGRAGSTRRGPSGPRGRAGRAVRGGAGDVPRAFAHGWAALSLPLRLGTPGPAAPARLVLFLSESPFRSDPPDGRRCHVAAVSYQRGRASGLGLDPGGGAGVCSDPFPSRTEAALGGFGRWRSSRSTARAVCPSGRVRVAVGVAAFGLWTPGLQRHPPRLPSDV
jgi:hypothetical protein